MDAGKNFTSYVGYVAGGKCGLRKALGDEWNDLGQNVPDEKDHPP